MDFSVRLCTIAFMLTMVYHTCNSTKEAMVNINNKKWLHLVHDKFLSLTLQPRHLFQADKFSIESLNMARGLAPAYIRVGGPESDVLQFSNNPEAPDGRVVVSESQWSKLNKFVSDCNLDLIICLSPLHRVNGVWDSRSTLELISMSNRNGYNLTWELGYESQKLRTQLEAISGAELGRDIARLRKILDSFPRYKGSDIIGPDIIATKSNEDIKFIKDYLIESGDVLNAITWHPPFSASLDEEDGVLKSLSMVYNGLDALLYGKDKIPKANQYVAEKPMWIAESESSGYSGGFNDALIWTRRLGTAARLGFYVFMHHVQEFAFNAPTPDFWVSLLYKNLVGRAVLETRVVSGNSTLQVFSHCTAVDELPTDPVVAESYSYERGAITMFGENSLEEDVKLSLKTLVKNEKMHIYILTEGSDGSTLLNGQTLSLSPSGHLPVILPKVRFTNRNLVYVIPPKSVFFIVFPEAHVRTCSNYPGTTMDEKNPRVIKKSTNIASSVATGDHVSGEINQKETYVQFVNPNSSAVGGLKPNTKLEQVNKIVAGKVNILRGRADKYRTNEKNYPKNEDLATSNVKYVLYSDSTWLPKTLPLNEFGKTVENVILTLNNSFNGNVKHGNDSLKTLSDSDTGERQEKYTLLANAIFGKRNVSSKEIINTLDNGNDGYKILQNRQKRFTDVEKPSLLDIHPITSKLKPYVYPFISKLATEQNNLDSKKIKINQQNPNDINVLFPTGDVYVQLEGEDFNTDQDPSEEIDMNEKVEQDKQFQFNALLENYNPKTKTVYNRGNVEKSIEELSEAELKALKQGHNELGNQNAYDHKMREMGHQQVFVDGNMQDKLSFERNNERGIKKKENSIPSFFPHTKISVSQHNSDESKHYDRDFFDNNYHYQISKSFKGKRSVNEDKTDQEADNVFENNGHFNISDEEQLTELLKELIDEGEELLEVLSAERKESKVDVSNQQNENITNTKLVNKVEESTLMESMPSNASPFSTVNSEKYDYDKSLQPVSVLNKASKQGTSNPVWERQDDAKQNEDTSRSIVKGDDSNNNIMPSYDNASTRSPRSMFSFLTGEQVREQEVSLGLDKSEDQTTPQSSGSMSTFLTDEQDHEEDVSLPLDKAQDHTSTPGPRNTSTFLTDGEEDVSLRLDKSQDHPSTRSPRSMSIFLADEQDHDEDVSLRLDKAEEHEQEGQSDDSKPSTNSIETTSLTSTAKEDVSCNITNKTTDDVQTMLTSVADAATAESVTPNKMQNKIIITRDPKSQNLNDTQMENSTLTTESIVFNQSEKIMPTEKPLLETTLKNGLSKLPNRRTNVLKSTQIVDNNTMLPSKNGTKKQESNQEKNNRTKKNNDQIELLRARLLAYREHLNELANKRTRHKRDNGMIEKRQRRILKKDSPYAIERKERTDKTKMVDFEGGLEQIIQTHYNNYNKENNYLNKNIISRINADNFEERNRRPKQDQFWRYKLGSSDTSDEDVNNISDFETSNKLRKIRAIMDKQMPQNRKSINNARVINVESSTSNEVGLSSKDDISLDKMQNTLNYRPSENEATSYEKTFKSTSGINDIVTKNVESKLKNVANQYKKVNNENKLNNARNVILIVDRQKLKDSFPNSLEHNLNTKNTEKNNSETSITRNKENSDAKSNESLIIGTYWNLIEDVFRVMVEQISNIFNAKHTEEE